MIDVRYQDKNESDFFNLQQDSVSKRTKSQCEIPAAIFDEIHGEIDALEKKHLINKGIIMNDSEPPEGMNSIDQSTNLSDGMGLITMS